MQTPRFEFSDLTIRHRLDADEIEMNVSMKII